MSLHSELLKQAGFLARKEPRKPTQASLRRSASACHCALFHLLVDDATRLMLSENGVGLRVLTGQGAQIDTTTASGRLVFGILPRLRNSSGN